MRKFISAVLAVVMLCLCFGAGSVFAAEGDYELTVNFDNSLGGVEIVTEGQTITAVPPESSVWNPNKAMPKGTEFSILNGAAVVSAAGEDFKYAALNSTVKINSYSFKSTIQGSNNGEVTASGISGNVIKLDCKKSGTMSIAVNLGAGKTVKAANTADVENLLVNYKAEAAGNYLLPFNVEAGQSYYFWGVGTKPQFYGLVFSSSAPIAAKAGNTVTIKATPNDKGLLGNVRLSDESVAIEKNSDMTECTFTMPEKNLSINVDFLSISKLNDELQKIDFNVIKGQNVSETQVDSDLELYSGWSTSIGYADVSWTSSNEAAISVGGIVNPQKTDTEVTLTAIFTYQPDQPCPNVTLKREYVLKLPADTDDAAAVATAKDSLTLGDTSAVKSDLELPISGRKNTDIKWSSSDPETIDNTGKVTRKAGADTNVTLTATISRGTVSDTKDFSVTVLGYVVIEIERVAVSNSNGDVVLGMSANDTYYVSHVVYTDNIQNKTGNEQLIVAVYDKNDGTLKTCKMFNLAEITKKTGEETILYLNKDKIPVDINSQIKVFALDGTQSLKPLMKNAYVYDNSVANNATIYIAGDSTACTYPATGAKNRFPQTGWAAVLQDYFTGVKVDDRALSGRSSVSFLKDDNYKVIKNNIKAGDYFVIQFGHNDQKINNINGDRFTSGSYKNSLLTNYINVALDKGAYPILTTSISRRKLSDAGLEPYVNATKELGYELGLPVVDLYAKTNGYINRVGLEKSKDIFNHLKSKDSRFVNCKAGEFSKSQYYTTDPADNTHINYFGAQMISQWFCDELVRIGHPLTSKRSSHTFDEQTDLPSYADATTVN